MSKADIISWRRLVASILIAATLAIFFELTANGGFPTRDELPSIAVGFLFLAVCYAVFITVLYALSITVATFKVSPWITFFALYVCASTAFHYFSLSAYESDELGGRILVSNHHITAEGWSYFTRNIFNAAVIAAVSASVLFANFGRKSRLVE